MARSRSWNPFAFYKTQVTVIGSVIYVALLVALLAVHLTVPSTPKTATPVEGINLTQAWSDLQGLTNGYHPWGSVRNEEVRAVLIERVKQILAANDATYSIVEATSNGFSTQSVETEAATVFVSDTSNVTSWDTWQGPPSSVYVESQNILVYIRGQDDKEGNWWNETTAYEGTSGVLVNAHYDSVSSGYGATDDGMGVVSILQLISYFTKKGNQPKRGIVALLNNGEEKGLYGAQAFVQHPLSRFTRTFLNLEGAGAGGRAMLFRSTDTEVTRAYAKSPYPFGTITTGDGFKRGLVRSGTDYSVLTQQLDLRGLDVSFYRPRARYHTDQDDVRGTSVTSLWHMLSAAIATVKELSSYEGDEFDGGPSARSGSAAVYFDMFGRALAVLRLHDIFALSVTLLTVGPIVFVVLEVALRRTDHWYLFANKKYLHSSDDDEVVRLHGRRGFFRFPVAFIAAGAVVAALAYLVTKINPYIIYSSEYAVWAMMLSAYFVVTWFLLAGAANIRPTALQRMFVLIWLYAFSWIVLVVGTIGENNYTIGSGYFALIYNASVFVALLISYVELFSLTTTTQYVESVLGTAPDTASRVSSRDIPDRDPQSSDIAEPDERTSLLRGRTRSSRGSNTFTGLIRRQRTNTTTDGISEQVENSLPGEAYPDEQPWSSQLPQWTWIVQFTILVPINTIIIGQIALIMSSSLHQTLADGNSALSVYLFMAALTVFLLLPLTPFIHRVSHQIPTFLFLVFIGCMIYNLVAFPFSRDARLKVFFVQKVDLDTGVNNATLVGLDEHVQNVITNLPSFAGQELDCDDALISGRRHCRWRGRDPKVVPDDYLSSSSVPFTDELTTRDWLTFDISYEDNLAQFSLQGLNTKSCRVSFDHAVSQINVEEGAANPYLPSVAEGGSKELQLLSRTWDKTFRFNVTWESAPAKGQKGRVVCLWEDANERGVIPAWDELLRFAPVWSAPTKLANGLVEGWKAFEI